MMEYKVLGLRAADDMEDQMNALAAEGWEFAGATESPHLAIVIMDRRKKSEAWAAAE